MLVQILKKRYSFNEDYSKIRANQGHSVSSVNVELTPVKLQKDVYHGTSPEAIESILSQGLTPQYRNYVHMSSDIETAITVGKRHSKDEDPIILCISKEVPEVFISENNVLLTEYVDPKYINILKGQ